MTPAALWARVPRAVRGLAWLAAAYALAAWAFAAWTERGGLLTPSGAPRPALVALGAVFLALRIALVLGAPALLAYAAARWALARRA